MATLDDRCEIPGANLENPSTVSGAPSSRLDAGMDGRASSAIVRAASGPPKSGTLHSPASPSAVRVRVRRPALLPVASAFDRVHRGVFGFVIDVEFLRTRWDSLTHALIIDRIRRSASHTNRTTLALTAVGRGAALRARAPRGASHHASGLLLALALFPLLAVGRCTRVTDGVGRIGNCRLLFGGLALRLALRLARRLAPSLLVGTSGRVGHR